MQFFYIKNSIIFESFTDSEFVCGLLDSSEFICGLLDSSEFSEFIVYIVSSESVDIVFV